ncbi:hypothetical protein J0X19_00335 [Hymenobacter sp. BT186]|uniref:Outer membrane protein assembly factor BamE n=1 Tax=Hymenobacter telluris TaxID=2816474 RepID=A0A939EUX7_9BACT|nr:hypothetical protein [Hymenobacter telluris]MBO0356378.1 hypothetical protein [Hymenobacter telluris]MBW3372402.1 hypothetical protein [Hymenobacter norwichensis]
MKLLFQLSPLLLSLAVACQSNPSTPAAASAAAPAKPAAVQPAATVRPVNYDSIAAAARANPEFIRNDMLTINGQQHDETTIQALVKQLGRPDSIAREAVECAGMLDTGLSDKADIWYYGRTVYEVYKSTAVLSSFDVTSGKFQGKLGKLVLDKNTTLKDVRRFYPLSAKDADVPAPGRLGEEMSLPFKYKGEWTDYSLVLFFKKGVLQEVGFFTPC